MIVSTHRIGSWGERIAAEYLERCGWRIIDRNFRVGRKEVDLIARREGVLAFVEVKTRRSLNFGHPLSAVAARKRHTIRQVAEGWVARFGERDLEYRFDAVSVERRGAGKLSIQHVENAWGF